MPLVTMILKFSLTASASIPPGENAFVEGERLIYTKIVEAFRNNQLPVAIIERDRLAKNYPASVHLDRAYYLTGVLEFQRQNLSGAARDFTTVIERFPLSHKRPAALFARAATYGKLNLDGLAMKVWQQILREYPGSPESRRAEMQIKVARANLSRPAAVTN